MATEDSGRPLEALAERARERSARLAAGLERRQGLPPEPGDLFVLAATAELPVEWAILDRRSSGELLAVPADTQPLAGSADVEVEDGVPGGPLSLRCRFGVWLAAAAFDPDLRSGFLAPETVEEALHRWRRIEAGELETSPLAEEVDADPEYVDWMRDVPARARELAAAVRLKGGKAGSPAFFWSGVHRLAAALAVVSVGLAVWVALLLRQVDRLGEPIFHAPSEEVVLGSEVRGGVEVLVAPEVRHVELVLVAGSTLEPGEGRLEIADREGEPVWRSGPVEIGPARDFSLILRRELLPDGEYRVRLYRGAGFSGPPVAEKTVRVETVDH